MIGVIYDAIWYFEVCGVILWFFEAHKSSSGYSVENKIFTDTVPMYFTDLFEPF